MSQAQRKDRSGLQAWAQSHILERISFEKSRPPVSGSEEEQIWEKTLEQLVHREKTVVAKLEEHNARPKENEEEKVHELEAELQASIAKHDRAIKNMELAQRKLRISELLQESRQCVKQLEDVCASCSSDAVRAHSDRIESNRQAALAKRAAKKAFDADHNLPEAIVKHGFSKSETAGLPVKRMADAMAEGVLINSDKAQRIAVNREAAAARRARRLADEETRSQSENSVQKENVNSEIASQAVDGLE